MSARLVLRTVARSRRAALRPLQQLRANSGAGNEKTAHRSFREQLYDSTARRVQEEKAKTEARLLTGKTQGVRTTGGSSATLAGLFGLPSSSPGRDAPRLLTARRYDLYRRRVLLPR